MNKQTQKGLLDIVEKNYNNIAREFNETRKKELWQELLNITKSIKDNDKILDVGCGNGRIIDALIEKKIKYQGVDQSTELINLAKKNYSNIPNAKFSVGKIGEIELIFNFLEKFNLDLRLNEYLELFKSDITPIKGMEQILSQLSTKFNLAALINERKLFERIC